MSSRLEMALKFADHDFPVGPLCRPTADGCSYRTHAKQAPCKYPGKAPIPYAGVHGFTTDPTKIQQFFTWYPDANLGVAMGGDYFVIEADGPEGLAWVQGFHLEPTVTVISRRGPHAYLRNPPGYHVKTMHLKDLHVDIIGDGDYVVGPGSVHASDHIYRWQEYLSLEDLEPTYPPEPLIAWMAEHGVLRRGATKISRPMQSKRLQTASRLHVQTDPRPRVHAGRLRSGTASNRRPALGGFKTIFTSRLETCGTALGATLAEFAKKPEIRDACLTFFGLGDVAVDLGFGKAFLCRLPGHRERHPSAVLEIADNDHLVYHDLHASDDELKVYTLPDLYRVQLLGRVLRPDEALKGPSVLPWWERLLIEVGYLEPVPVPARSLPDGAPEPVHRVYSGFLYLYACKGLYEAQQATAFSVRFGMEWCGIGSHHTFREALRWLVQHRYIDELPPMTTQKGQRLALYRPSAP
jgi:hypothetical protein